MGGKPCPAVGFGMGIERLVLTMQSVGASFGEVPSPDLFIANIGSADAAFLLTMQLREKGVNAECDTMARSLKSQMKLSDKLAAKFTVVIGETEIKEGIVKVKKMADGSEESVGIADLADYIIKKKG